ncbi:MAG: helicase-related protein [bacterium]|nr:helicase-related protein [bacterium]
MPRIYDNIESALLPALRETISRSYRADFCVGFFNLRGWKGIASEIDRLAGGAEHCCRLLIGMQKRPDEELRAALRLSDNEHEISNEIAAKLKKKVAIEFRDQLMLGAPSNADEQALRHLAAQMRAGKVVVKVFLKHLLHAKLYILHREDFDSPLVSYLGSSNLTFAGLSKQGELNIDVKDDDACKKLAAWFNDRWNEDWCIDITKELIQVIEESWACEVPLSPYLIYLKMAYHLSREARAGLTEFKLPPIFEDRLFEFQKAAVKIAAHHLNKRGGVVIGDVVGLGKTLMATAIARICEDDHGLETLIICPKNLVAMWEDYRLRYGLRAKVLSITETIKKLPDLQRFRLVLIDESHNLRNREGRRYHVIHDYIERNESKCMLLSATPYNKSYLDLSNQLRLFVPEDKDLGVRPDCLLRVLGETEFIRRHQCQVRTLAAFEKSNHADDWRELMRLYMVRRTRSFIQQNYATTDETNGRRYLTFSDGSRSYFPTRVPRTLAFTIKDGDPNDQYGQLFAIDVVDIIRSLDLPRYGLGNYILPQPQPPATAKEAAILQNLSRAGRRLMGFCRTNLFKRLESCGHAFVLSVQRHILRNYVFLYAIEQGLPVPIGTLNADAAAARNTDDDPEIALFDENGDERRSDDADANGLATEADFAKRAAELYKAYATAQKKLFTWVRSNLFAPQLAEDLRRDADNLMKVFHKCPHWNPALDEKLKALHALLADTHAQKKVIVFSQFADTVEYLAAQLSALGVTSMAGVTGGSDDPTALAWRFSPVSNDKRKRVAAEDELRILIATDVLSEGQNLQDCNIIVNFDLPWAIIRLIQRAGRVDRIGQQAQDIFCYSFLPADGVERLIRLRASVRQRLQENAAVVGTDEMFFEDDHNEDAMRDLFTEKAGILDGEDDSEVDLASYAYQIWKNALDRDPALRKTIEDLPNVVCATRAHQPTPQQPDGVLVYVRTAEDNDSLAWLDAKGKTITESQLAILKAAECPPDTPGLPHNERHHEIVRAAVVMLAEEEKNTGGQLGRPSGARFRTYERLQSYARAVKGTLFDTKDLERAIQDIYRFPLLQSAADMLNRQLRTGVADDELAKMVLTLREAGRLCAVRDEEQTADPSLICSLGLFAKI